MPPKKSKSKTTKSKNEAPPLPDEAPPLPDEQPPLPDEAPPLPDEQPPLPSEAPTEAPPLPDEQPPLPDEAPPLPEEPVPLKDADEAGDAASSSEEKKDKEKGEDEEKAVDPAAWQAVWAPEQNAYYFWNKDTGEVTWTNPLAPPLPSEPAPDADANAAAGPSRAVRPAPSAIPDIDPALAHLLPPEQRGADGAPLGGLKYAPQDYNYSFTHLDEYNRAKRFSEHYFNVDEWEKQKAAESYKRKAEEEAGIVSNKKITKKDMERFRAKKAEQKARRQAWLYD